MVSSAAPNMYSASPAHSSIPFSAPASGPPCPPQSLTRTHHHTTKYIPSTISPQLFQSLAQMNVPHLHCVPVSFCPLGPIGLAHIQNCLPQFTPGFFVVSSVHGSACPSHRGDGFLENSFVQPSFDASCEARGSVWMRDEVEVAPSVCEKGRAVVASAGSFGDGSGGAGSVGGLGSTMGLVRV